MNRFLRNYSSVGRIIYGFFYLIGKVFIGTATLKVLGETSQGFFTDTMIFLGIMTFMVGSLALDLVSAISLHYKRAREVRE